MASDQWTERAECLVRELFTHPVAEDRVALLAGELRFAFERGEATGKDRWLEEEHWHRHYKENAERSWERARKIEGERDTLRQAIRIVESPTVLPASEKP